jgi:hypothetical protein
MFSGVPKVNRQTPGRTCTGAGVVCAMVLTQVAKAATARMKSLRFIHF